MKLVHMVNNKSLVNWKMVYQLYMRVHPYGVNKIIFAMTKDEYIYS